MDLTSLTGVNRSFVADLYARFLTDKQSVDASWRTLFVELGDDAHDLLAELNGPSWSIKEPVDNSNDHYKHNGHEEYPINSDASTKGALEKPFPLSKLIGLEDFVL